MRKVEVVPHNPKWQDLFKAESKSIAKVLQVVAIHHIGSTSITNIYAKPIVDILVEVKDINDVDGCNNAMENLGYQAMGEFGIIDRRYFRKHTMGVRTHHVHVFETDSPQVTRHLAFRDYMNAHPTDAKQYSELKRKLAAKYPDDIESYMDGKDAFIKDMDRKAALWQTI